MMNTPRSLWHPVLVALDEAQRYAPTFANVESSEALTLLVTAGRKRGFGAIFAVQRLSAISKDVLGQCPNKVMGRVDQALDRKIAAEVLGFAPSSNESRELLRLKHQFWIAGPALAPQPELVRFAPCVTTHLRPGQAKVPPLPAPEKVRAMLSVLSKGAGEVTCAGNGKVARGAAGDHETLRRVEERGFARGREAGEKAGRDRTLWELVGRLERAQAACSGAISELASVLQTLETPEAGKGEVSKAGPKNGNTAFRASNVGEKKTHLRRRGARRRPIYQRPRKNSCVLR
jgi:hypothetical protein